MAAPNVFQTSGVRAGGDALFNIVAQRETERLLAAKQAEAAMRQRMQDDAARAAADLAERRVRLDENRFEHEVNKPKDRKTVQVRGVDVEGKPTTQLVYEDTGEPVRSFQEHVTPKERKTVQVRGVDVGGKPTTQLVYEDTGEPVRSFQEHVTPPKPPAPNFSVMPLSGPDGQQGLYRINPDTGQIIPFAGGFKPLSSDKPPRVSEQDNLKFYNRIVDGDNTMNRIEDSGQLTKQDLTIIHEFDSFPTTAQGLGLSKAGREYLQGVRMFVMAHGRDDSGAAIQDTEWKNFRDTYIPNATDHPELIAQRRASRGVVKATTAASAGAAFREHFGYDAPTPANRQTVTRGADGKLPKVQPK